MTGLERLRSIHDDVGLARLIRKGYGNYVLSDFKVAELRKWLEGSYRRGLYNRFDIQKKNGKSRQILAPHFRLKTVQRLLNAMLVEGYSPPAPSHAYVSERGPLSNAKPHVGQEWVLKVDIENFFHSIHFGRVRGLLRKAPFELSEDIAEMVALISTYPVKWYVTVLPQGSPLSPLLSNLVCRALDRDLAKLANTQRCFYTRYSDDITFSTDRRVFPPEIARMITGDLQLGDHFQEIISKHDFRLNGEKTYLHHRRSQQRVTGIVVNRKLNVDRRYVRNLRAAIHCWKTLGLEEAQRRFVQNFDRKYRPSGKAEPRFDAVIRGRLHHVARVRGWNDPVVWTLANKLSEVDPTYDFDVRQYINLLPTVTLFTEGRTDQYHIMAALDALQERGEFTNLEIRFDLTASIKGDAQLIKNLRRQKDSHHMSPQFYLFDNDNVAILATVTDGELPRRWGPNVYSGVLPIPDHRVFPFCIELYYKDVDLKAVNSDGRRIFAKSEFDSDGNHKSDSLRYTRPQSKSLLVSDKVLDAEGRSVALSKAQFAEAVREKEAPFSAPDFSGFRPLFSMIRDVVSRNLDVAGWPDWVQAQLNRQGQ